MSAAPPHDCVGALLVRDGYVLLGQRAADRDWLPGAWDLFGGHVEPGEIPADALRRELREELGIATTQMHELALLQSPDAQGWRLRVFVVTAWQGEPANLQPREHSQLRWCTREEATRLLSGAHRDFTSVLARALAG